MHNETFHTTLMRRLLNQMKSGDSDARNELITGAQRRLFLLSKRMLSSFPKIARLTEPEDILQAASLRLLRALDSLTPDSTVDFFNLAAVQVRRELVDLARRFKKMNIVISQGESQELISTSSESSPDPPDLDLWEAFHLAVEQLEVVDREIFGLIYYHGWTQDEVADLLKLNVRTVRRHWSTSIRQLQELVRGGNIDPAL